MITELTIKNFKCFSDESIAFNKLTVLCGPNAGGKSTIIQAILLHVLAQRSGETEIPLNGPFGLFLGDADSLVSRNETAGTTSDMIEVGLALECAEQTSWYAFETCSSRRSLKPICKNASTVGNTPISLCYLSAERIGPRLLQDKYSDSGKLNTDVGYSGQFTAEVLEQYERHHVRLSVSEKN